MTSNLPNTQTSTETFFNTYYNQSISINVEVYDRIFAFFKTKTSSELAAKQLTQNLVALTYKNKIDPMDIIADFAQAKNASDLRLLFITFFNSLRNPKSKVGVGNALTVNQWVQRNIIT
jgi:hypothetical protein